MCGVHACVFMCVRVPVCMHMNMYTCMCVYAHVCVPVYAFVYNYKNTKPQTHIQVCNYIILENNALKTRTIFFEACSYIYHCISGDITIYANTQNIK